MRPAVIGGLFASIVVAACQPAPQQPPVEETGSPPVAAPFALRPVEDPLLAEFFAKRVDVFGVPIVASEATPDSKVLHAAHVMAQYLDNDEDGVPDNQRVVDTMIEQDALLIMFADFDELENSGLHNSELREQYRMQDLEGHETVLPGDDGFDAAIEEVHHLIAFAGYAEAYPDVFGEVRGSQIADAMDLARGGYFENVPDAYPEDAWYHYDDTTCEYACMITEYHYWAMTSLLGAQADPERCGHIAVEWKPCTPELVKEMDPAVHALLTNPEYGMPTVLPDGSYR